MNIKKKLCAVGLGVCLVTGTMAPVTLSEVKTAEASWETAVFMDILVIKYRLFEGKLQYRRWNETKGVWADADWMELAEAPVPTGAFGQEDAPQPTDATGGAQHGVTTGDEKTTADATEKEPHGATMGDSATMDDGVATGDGRTPADATEKQLYSTTPGDGEVASVNFVEINEENFGDAAFCAYLKEAFDTDGDGRLSDTERSRVWEICFQIEKGWLPEGECGSGILTGFRYFERLHMVSTDYGRQIWIQDCPELASVFLASPAGEPIGELILENCPVQTLVCHDFTGRLIVDGCGALKNYLGRNSKPAQELFLNGTPLLSMKEDERECLMEADSFGQGSYLYQGNAGVALYERREGDSLSLVIPNGVTMKWTGVTEDSISLDGDWTRYFPEAVTGVYSFAVLERDGDTKDGKKPYYCCVTYLPESVRKESFAFLAEDGTSPEDFYVKPKEIREAWEVYAYSPSGGMIFKARLENYLYYRGGDGDVELGRISNSFCGFWGLDADGGLRFFRSLKEAKEAFGFNN